MVALISPQSPILLQNCNIQSGSGVSYKMKGAVSTTWKAVGIPLKNSILLGRCSVVSVAVSVVLHGLNNRWWPKHCLCNTGEASDSCQFLSQRRYIAGLWYMRGCTVLAWQPLPHPATMYTLINGRGNGQVHVWSKHVEVVLSWKGYEVHETSTSIPAAVMIVCHCPTVGVYYALHSATPTYYLLLWLQVCVPVG